MHAAAPQLRSLAHATKSRMAWRDRVVRTHRHRTEQNPSVRCSQTRICQSGAHSLSLSSLSVCLSVRLSVCLSTLLLAGMVGADISNICNEAALIAARSDKEFVELVRVCLSMDTCMRMRVCMCVCLPAWQPFLACLPNLANKPSQRHRRPRSPSFVRTGRL
jgi:hypothetical protein